MMENKLELEQLAELCTRQEEQFQFESFSRQDALRLGLQLAEAARAYSAGVAIEITINGLSVFRYFPEGTTLDNSLWLARKARTVSLTGVSSLHAYANLTLSGETLDDRKLDPRDYAFCGGGFPLLIRGVGMVGVIAVSGLPHLEDHALIAETLEEIFG